MKAIVLMNEIVFFYEIEKNLTDQLTLSLLSGFVWGKKQFIYLCWP